MPFYFLSLLREKRPCGMIGAYEEREETAMLEQIAPRIWRMNDRNRATIYLVVGKEKAYAIDSGNGLDPLMPELRAVTGLPIELLVTHAHPDHVGSANEFDTVWLFREEYEHLDELERRVTLMDRVLHIDRDRIRVFDADAIFDAGDVSLRVVPLRGHTPGSVVFVDDADRAAFMGDAIGSGNISLISLPCTYDIPAYRASLERFTREAADIEGYTWHGGHYHQAGVPGTPGYNPLRMDIVRDMIRLCDALCARTITGQYIAPGIACHDACLEAHLGCAGLIYYPEQIPD